MRARLARNGGFAAIVLVLGAAAALLGEQAPNAPHYRVPMVDDWTHHSLIYSAPRTIFQNLQLQGQTRYAQQYLRRNVFRRGPTGPPIFDPIRILRRGRNGLQRDWGIPVVLAPVTNTGTVGQGNFPAKYTFSNYDAMTFASCANDYVVFTTTQGAGLDIYAVNNLYINGTGASATGLCVTATIKAPTVLWAYHVQTGGGTSNTSPVLSLDGTQIAWVEGGGGNARLHLLKPWAGSADGTIATPNTPPNTTLGAYRACTPTAPTGGGGRTSHACLTSITFNGGNDDTGNGGQITPSAPYYDYTNDNIFAGDDAGNLHQFTGIFNGTPAEVTGGATGWPVAVSTDATPDLGSPVYDETSGNVFVADFQGNLFYVRVAAGSAGTCAAGAPPCKGSTMFNDGDVSGTTKITGSPIVDSTTQRVFVFFSPNGGGPGAYVGQNNTTLSLAAPPLVNVGVGTAWRLNQGTLDNAYYNTDTGLGTGTGHIYFIGNNGAGDFAFLQRIAVTNGTMAGTVDSAAGTNWVASNASSRSSPATEFFNATTGVDYLFFGVEAGGAATACAGNGCVYAVTITGGALTVPPAAGTGAVNSSGGTSGIIVDNDSASTGAASIYFTWLMNGTGTATYPCNGATTTSVCAVKLTQSALQ